MTLNSINFQGSRLREARWAREISASGLAELISLSPSAISHFENSKTSPSYETLEKIAEKLNFPIGYFITKNSEDIEYNDTTFYRSFSSETKSNRKKAEIRIIWLRRLVEILRDFIEFVDLNLPNIGEPLPPHKITDSYIEEIALLLRKYWGMGIAPISNMALLLENKGFIVIRNIAVTAKLDAFSRWPSWFPHPLIILCADKKSCVRSRFDAAHELGHMILHAKVKESDLEEKTDLLKLIEKQANSFASAFLLPKETFLNEIQALNLDGLISLKHRWKVSVACMIERLYNLKLIDAYKRKLLISNLNRRGWGKLEPLDDILPIEEPAFIAESIKALINNKVFVFSELSEKLGLHNHDLEMLVGLENDFFNEKPQPKIICMDTILKGEF
jgi:Zn-dependent peptidase ImmA (M78 family)